MARRGGVEPSDVEGSKASRSALSTSGIAGPPAEPSPSVESLSPSYCEVRMLNPAPYFYYVDHSRDIDDDPLSPLSPVLSIPNFVIKLHAILIREDLSDVIAWMPHGRSWKILNQVRLQLQQQ
jgi:hypothetical protein